MTKQFSAAMKNAVANAYETGMGTGPRLRLYSGSQPALTTDAATGTLLAEAILPSDWMGAASAGVASLIGTWADASNDASGTAAYYRFYDSAGSVCHEQGSVGTSGADMNLSSTAIVAGGSFTITSWTETASLT